MRDALRRRGQDEHGRGGSDGRDLRRPERREHLDEQRLLVAVLLELGAALRVVMMPVAVAGQVRVDAARGMVIRRVIVEVRMHERRAQRGRVNGGSQPERKEATQHCPR